MQLLDNIPVWIKYFSKIDILLVESSDRVAETVAPIHLVQDHGGSAGRTYFSFPKAKLECVISSVFRPHLPDSLTYPDTQTLTAS